MEDLQVSNRHHPTPPRSPLIGRKQEIDAVCALLGRRDVALVSLTGPGGVGKTRLALHIMEVAAHGTVDATTFVDLSSVTDPSQVLVAIGRSLELQDLTRTRVLDQLSRTMGDGESLLVLDNFEHILDAAPTVSDLLARCPALTILATSRERLQLQEEHVYPVAPLAIPLDIREHSIEQLVRFDAVQLFTERAKALDASFNLADAQIEAIADICNRLDGLPLAIELAASRTRTLPPDALQKRLQRLLPVLSSGGRDRPERQKTMQKTIAWSYDLLDPDEQRFFRWLSVFAGGFTLEAAEVVTTSIAGDGLSTLDAVASLVEKSLLRLEHARDHESRYGMLESVREFGRDQLTASGEEPMARDAQAVWCLALSKDAAARKPVIQMSVIELLEREHANIRAALGWLNDSGRVDDLMAMVVDLTWFWYLSAREAEGLAWLERMIASRSDTATFLHIEALSTAGMLAQRLQTPEAELYLNRALTLARRYHDEAQQADLTKMLGILAEDKGDYDESKAYLQAAKTIYLPMNDPWNVAVLDYHLGIVAYGQGDYASAITQLEAARAAGEKIGDALVPNWCLAYLSLIAVEQGQRGRASELLRQLRQANSRSALPTHYLDHHPLSLGIHAVLAASIGAWASTARLLGAIAADHRSAVIALPETAAFERAEAQARLQKGDAGFSQEWNIGQKLHFEDIDAEIERVLSAAERASPPPKVEGEQSLLTPREREVLKLLVDGCSNREIAETLFVSHRTATTHVTHILTKLGVETRTAAVTYAFQHGMVDTAPST